MVEIHELTATLNVDAPDEERIREIVREEAELAEERAMDRLADEMAATTVK